MCKKIEVVGVVPKGNSGKMGSVKSELKSIAKKTAGTPNVFSLFGTQVLTHNRTEKQVYDDSVQAIRSAASKGNAIAKNQLESIKQ